MGKWRPRRTARAFRLSMDIERIEHLLERIDATPDLTEMDLRYRKMLLRKVARNRRVLADAVELRESRNPAPQAESA